MIKRTAEILEESRETVFDSTRVGLWNLNVKTSRVTYNETFLRLIGYHQEELKGTREEWGNFYHSEDRNALKAELDRLFNGEINECTSELRLRHKNGEFIWGLSNCFIVEKDEKGHPIIIAGSHINIDKIRVFEEKLQTALREIEQQNENLKSERGQDAVRLAKAERNTREMFDANPHATIMLDDKFRVIDGNPAALAFYGFTDKDEFLKNVMAIVQSAIPDVQVSGDKSISLADRFRYTVINGYHEFSTIINLNEEQIPLNVIFKKVEFKESFVIIGFQYDLRTLKKVQSDLEKQDRLLKAVNELSQILLAADASNFNEEIWKSLDILGKNTNVDRVYVWENNTIDGKLYCTQTLEWSYGAEPQQGNDLTINMPYDEVIPDWKTTLNVGKCMNSIVSQLSEAERKQLEPQGVVSLLIVPIFVHEKFWGFIGFDDCKKERLFSDTEENILRSAGLLIASAVLRNEIHKSLLQAKDEATRNANVKSQFLANMSHEIRTPMNAVIGMTNIAMASNDKKRIDECLQKISLASRHLLSIINDILDMSKIDANKFEISNNEFDLIKAVEGIYSIALNQAQEKQQEYLLEINENVPSRVIGDELRLAQVITNLLSNAVKFTPEKGKIVLKVENLGETDDEVKLKFMIKDSGIGIPKEKINVLFNAFEQLDLRVTKKYGGTGLGLAICKRIATLMDGKIEVESELDKGSTFSLVLTLKKGVEIIGDERPNNVNHKDDFSGKTVLLVEDIEINREIVLALLEPTNAAVDSAENGEIALEMFAKNPLKYDLIFMDIHMPIMDGYEATSRIRTLDVVNAKTIPIVAMTANAFAEDVKRCLDVGMNDHIAKPIDFEEVLIKLNKYLS